MAQPLSSHIESGTSLYKAWGVHAFTASGVLLGTMAMLSLIDNNPVACLLWLGAAMLVDGVDGSLARKYEVKTTLPHFDGATLDMVIDYLTWAFIPALFIYFFVALPPHVELLAVFIILLSSMFCFCNVNMKSQDNFFVGFPAAWNIAAIYFYVLDLPPFITFATIVLLAILTVTRMKFLHPFRVRLFMPLNIAITLVWFVSATSLVLSSPEHAAWALWGWGVASVYVVGMCLWRTAQEWNSATR
ncbi:CDP-alcohol phosphatidyltransferase family protein [Halomonas vilamensis]|uniref:Phosphatidylcholine synthase n=1 Tax=Vreelandella vilamensis TaxID=531309 RepID=A0ABU1H2L7_9GAMM|nr:CDP-alcohol phosphatidyltransferase family protein [Halomonas vilamensis]MDR5898464.1 CDP-alcohol phosphatidyltransferase family protein [Halomonas vilamensis]